jgi:LemA protein
MKTSAKIAIGIGVAALVLFFMISSSYNGLVTLDESINNARGNLEADLQRRLDLIPNLVETVKGYAGHERETLEAVTKARQQVTSAGNLDQRLNAEQGLSSALSRLMVVVERYPDLKASQGFRQLQDQLEGTENRIKVSRRDFNQRVQEFNTVVRGFPTVILARLLGYQPKEAFTAAPEAQQAPKVQFK